MFLKLFKSDDLVTESVVLVLLQTRTISSVSLSSALIQEKNIRTSSLLGTSYIY
jgi:hypothetical protein